MFGSGAALVRFSPAGMVPLRRAGWTFPLAFIGALGGAQLVLWVRPEMLRPVVLVLLLAAAVGVLLRPRVHGGRAPSAAVDPAAALALGVVPTTASSAPGPGRSVTEPWLAAGGG